MRKLLLLALVASGAAVAQAEDVIWDNGLPKTTIFNGAESWLGYSSGNLGGTLTQRWWAGPFTVRAGGATITRVTANWFTPVGSDAVDVNFIIWKRTALNAPGNDPVVGGADIFAMGKLGDWSLGTHDPRLPHPDDTTWWGVLAPDSFLRFMYHDYPLTGTGGVSGPITLPAGDYYFTVYADGLGTGNVTGQSNIAWLSGSSGDNAALNPDNSWRATSWPLSMGVGGFQFYAPSNVVATPFMGDPRERWNVAFQLFGVTARKAGQVSGTVNWNSFVGVAPGLTDDMSFQWRIPLLETGTTNVISFRYPYIINSQSFSYGWSSPVADDRSYDAKISFRYWLRRTLNYNPANNYTGADFNMVNGDLVVDNDINSDDFDALVAGFGSSGAGGTSTDPAGDIDGSGNTDSDDFDILVANFGTVGDN